MNKDPLRSKEESSRSRVESGFTLIELLVTTAIIAVLAGLLLAAVAKASGSGKSLKCKSNLRQIVLATQLYVNDHGVYPNGKACPPPYWPGLIGNWPADLQAYLPLPTKMRDDVWTRPRYQGLWECPSDPLFPRGSSFWYTSYGYNVLGASWDDYPERLQPENGGLGLAVICNGPDGSIQRPAQVSEAEVKVPCDMIAYGDGFVGQMDGRTHETVFLARGGVGWNPRSYEPPGDQAYKRHRGKLNVAFCDGHIEALKTKQLFFDWSDEWTRKWNRDHEPHPEWFPDGARRP